MTMEDLHEQGVLLPEEEWGRHRLETTTRRVPLLLAFVLSGAALAVAFLGDGGVLTWIGMGAFLVGLFAIVWMCDRAVVRQRRRVRSERREVAEGEAADGGASPDGGARGRAPVGDGSG